MAMIRLLLAASVALTLHQDAVPPDDRTDLEKLTFGRCYWGAPVAPVDLQGRVIVVRNWAG